MSWSRRTVCDVVSGSIDSRRTKWWLTVETSGTRNHSVVWVRSCRARNSGYRRMCHVGPDTHSMMACWSKTGRDNTMKWWRDDPMKTAVVMLSDWMERCDDVELHHMWRWCQAEPHTVVMSSWNNCHVTVMSWWSHTLTWTCHHVNDACHDPLQYVTVKRRYIIHEHDSHVSYVEHTSFWDVRIEWCCTQKHVSHADHT